MVQKRTCDYSGQEIEPGTGTMYVKNDGTVLHFANAKCEKNYLLGREPRSLEWTQTARDERARAAADAVDVGAEEDEAEEVEEDEAEEVEEDEAEEVDVEDEDEAEAEADVEEDVDAEAEEDADAEAEAEEEDAEEEEAEA